MKFINDISILVYEPTFGPEQTGHIFAPITIEYDEHDTLSLRIVRLSRPVAGRNHALRMRVRKEKLSTCLIYTKKGILAKFPPMNNNQRALLSPNI